MATHNTIGKGSSHRSVNGGDDKYYTKGFIADYCSHLVLERYGHSVTYVEPCAGGGAFLGVLPNPVATDIKPEHPEVTQADVFDLKFGPEDVIVSNPPFGMNASLAKRIFNHIASQGPKAICFVVPRTFRKESTHSQLHLGYSVVLDVDLPDNSFTLDGEDYDVPCVFQIWERTKKPRVPKEPESCKWLEFVRQKDADVAVRRAGGKAGRVLEGTSHSASSTYFIRLKHPMVLKALKLMDIGRYVNNTAGVRSIAKSEVISEVNRIMEVLNGC